MRLVSTLIVLGMAASPGFSAEGASPSAVSASLNPLDRAAKVASSYLEGWFGAPVPLPPIEIVTGEPADVRINFPGHYRDGVIRIRAETLARESELRRVLRHELTHAVIDRRTRGNCPQWLQEGIAQFLDGTDVVATERKLRSEGPRRTPLFRMEGPFLDRDADARELAYSESASAVSFLVARIAKTGLLRLVRRLGEGRPFEDALLEVGLSYVELQQAWESSLRLPGQRN